MDYILVNGKFYTCNDELPWADAVAVKDGKFAAVGSWEQLSPCTAECPVYDLGGRLVLPGLIDSHTHIALSVQLGGDDDSFPMYNCHSKEEVLAALRSEVKKHPFSLFYGMFYGKAEALGPEGIHRDELDAIVRHRPVVLLEEECHSAYVNSATLKLLKIHDTTPDPAPGYSYYDRDENGRLTGGLKEMTMLPLLEISGGFKKKVMKAGMKKIMDYLVAHGVTTVYDAGSYLKEEDTYKLLKEMDAAGELPVRFEATHILHTPDLVPTAIEDFKHLRSCYTTEHIKFKTIKMMLDGTQRIRTAKMISPYADTGTTGGTLISQEQMNSLVLELNKEKIDFHLHTVGEGAIRMVMDAVENARSITGMPLDIRVTCAHVEVLHPDDIHRFKQLGIIANFTPSWHGGACAAEIPVMEHLLGEYRANNSLQAKTVWDTGATVTFSSDEVSLHMLDRWNPFLGMEIGHTRQEVDTSAAAATVKTGKDTTAVSGRNAPVFPPANERLPLENLIRGYTLNAAYQLRLDDQIGSIEPGKDADMVILRDNIFKIDPYEIHNIIPEAVIIQGHKNTGR